MSALILLTLASAAAAQSEAQRERGFLLIATQKPIALLRHDPSKDKSDELGAVLADVCATRYRALLVVGDDREKRIAEAKRPCTRVEVAVLRHRASDSIGHLRLFKVSALHKYCDYFPGGTLALDNDVALKITHIDDLFGIFDDMSTKAYGFGLDGRCVPEEHKEPGIPDDFCERNSGLIFFGDSAQSKEMTRAWLDEMRDRPTADGHDQGPLRRVLWRRRDLLYDLAPNVQCRRCTKRYGVDPCDYLAWHSHRPKRLQVFTNKTRACGFRDDRLRPESRR